MPSIFETAPSASAIPISFVTKASWPAIRDALPPAGRQFADANGYTAKPGGCLILPTPDGQIAQVLVDRLRQPPLLDRLQQVIHRLQPERLHGKLVVGRHKDEMREVGPGFLEVSYYSQTV